MPRNATLMTILTFLLGSTMFVGGQTELRAQPGSVRDPLEPLLAMQTAVVEAIARCDKSVVAIARIDDPEPGAPRGGIQGLSPRQDPESSDFFPDQFGTGIVVDRNGLILTNYHVVSPKATHWITTHDRKRYKARIKAADPRSDLAVLEIDARDLTPMPLGDGGALKKGQFAIALGNPYAIARDGSASAAWGLIANLGRRLPTDPSPNGPGRDKLYHYGMLIQTDAKLNLGTSGGALLNLRGEMIGLTTSLSALSGYEQAAGYALPTDETFRRVVDTLKQGREVEYGFLGVKPENLTEDELAYTKFGVRVLDVVNGTPAQRFGIQVGDIVTHVGTAEIRDIDDIVLKVGQFPVEATVPVKFLRNKRPIELKVELTKFPVRGEKIVTSAPDAWRGLTIDYATALNDDNLERATRMTNVKDGAVVVIRVDPNSPAANARLDVGTFITNVGDARVHNPKEFRAALVGRSGPVKLQVVRGSATTGETVEVTAK